LVSECGEGLYDDEDQKIKGSDYAELLEDCREQLTLKITALLDKNSAELDDFLKDITKTTGEKIKVTSDKEKTVKNFLKAMLAEKTVQMPIRQVLEKPLGNADLFQPASLFLRRNGLFKKNLGVVPDLVGEVLDPKMTFPSIVAVVETDMGEPQMSLSLLGYDKNGDEVVENQKVYPMGVAHMDFPEMTYLKGELTWKGDYTFSCRLTKQ